MEPTLSGHSVEVDATQALEGHILANPSATKCTACGRRLGSTDEVTVYAYRLAEAEQLDVPRIYCTRGCSPDSLVGTLGAADMLATARLGNLTHPSSRQYRLCLTEIEVQAFSGPNCGGSP